AEGSIPARVALVTELGELTALDQIGRHEQSSSEGVQGADVRVEQVVAVGTLAAQLGIKVEPAGGDAARAQDLVDRQGENPHRVRELVGVQTNLRAPAV